MIDRKNDRILPLGRLSQYIKERQAEKLAARPPIIDWEIVGQMLEQKRLHLEAEKLELETEKLKLEQSKPKRRFTMRHWLAFFIGFITFFLFAAFARYAHASGPETLTFQQVADCALVDHWDAFAAPGANVTPGDPSGVKIGSVANTGGTLCAGSALVSGVAPVSGVGNMTFWLVAVAANGTTSVASNGVTHSLPLQAPVLVSVHE